MIRPLHAVLTGAGRGGGPGRGRRDGLGDGGTAPTVVGMTQRRLTSFGLLEVVVVDRAYVLVDRPVEVTGWIVHLLAEGLARRDRVAYRPEEVDPDVVEVGRLVLGRVVASLDGVPLADAEVRDLVLAGLRDQLEAAVVAELTV